MFTKNLILHQLIEEGKCLFPDTIRILFPVVMVEWEQVLLSEQNMDEVVWGSASNRGIPVRGAYEFYRGKAIAVRWKKNI